MTRTFCLYCKNKQTVTMTMNKYNSNTTITLLRHAQSFNLYIKQSLHYVAQLFTIIHYGKYKLNPINTKVKPW